jgi:hypothetical protein
MATVTGTLTDVGGGHLAGKYPELVFELNAPNLKGSAGIHPTEPFRVSPASDGTWSADLVSTTDMNYAAWYTLSIRWMDPAGNFVRVDYPDWKFEVPTTGGPLATFAGKPSNQRMVYVSITPPTDPRPYTLWLRKNPDNPKDPAGDGNLYEWRNV